MLVKTLYILSMEKGGGNLGPPLKSAKGLFYKYTDRPGTDEVIWIHITAKGQYEEKARWKRADVDAHEKLRADGLLRGKAAPVPGSGVPRKPKTDGNDAGAYVVAHASRSLVATLTAPAVAAILADLKLPPLRKIVFISCHAAEPDELAIDDSRARDIKIKGDEVKDGEWVHGLAAEDLSFITMFACSYAETLKDPQRAFVAGWDCAVSIAESTKAAGSEIPAGLTVNDNGRKIIDRGGGWMIPTATRHRRAKKMFCWTVKSGEKASTVSAVEPAAWSDKA